MVEKTRFYAIAYAALGKGLSGGDNILIELSKRWADKLDITIKGGTQIYNAARKKNLLHGMVTFNICPSHTIFTYIERLFNSLNTAFRFNDKNCIIYTASDFPHDLLCGWIIKLLFPSVRWVAGYYLVAPPPFGADSPYHGKAKIRGIGYWLMQRFTLKIVNKWADIVYVTSVPEMKHFPNKKVVVVKGGVDIPKFTPIPKDDRLWDAIFIGRFHYQKGTLELIDVWYKVWHTIPNLVLMMVGNGALQKKCIKKIKRLKMEGFIYIEDFADDLRKDYLLRQSKIILHPATYDSGGMACAEGMAYGLPAVGFDLPVYQTYYARGMIKVKTIQEFADEIMKLLTDKKYYEHWSKEAKEYTKEVWDWDKRAEEIWEQSGF